MGRSDPGGLGVAGFLGTAGAIVVADHATKWLAVERLTPAYVPHPVFGEWVRLTLVYNPGAAFGLHLGPWSRNYWDRWITFFDNRRRPFYFRGTSGAFARFVNVYVGEHESRTLQGLATPLPAGALVLVAGSVAGG